MYYNLTSLNYYVAINDLNWWLHFYILYTIGWAAKKLKVTYTLRNATGSSQSYNFRGNNWVLYLYPSAIYQFSIICPKTLRNHLFCIFNYHLPSFLCNLFYSAFPRPTPFPIGLWIRPLYHYSLPEFVTSSLRQNCEPVSLFPLVPSSSPPFFSMIFSVH